jgi:hypothetical protein
MADPIPEREFNLILDVAASGSYVSTAVSLVRKHANPDRHAGVEYERIETIEPGCYLVTENGYIATVHRVNSSMQLIEMEVEYEGTLEGYLTLTKLETK